MKVINSWKQPSHFAEHRMETLIQSCASMSLGEREPAKYNLNQFQEITFNGFEILLPEQTMKCITELALQVGSPTYVRTPIFAKKERPSLATTAPAGGQHHHLSHHPPYASAGGEDHRRKKRAGIQDDDWSTIRTFQPTHIEQKAGIGAQIDILRSELNKITEKNYDDKSTQIVGMLKKLIEYGTPESDMQQVGNAIFDIASNNRFYSKVYANMYTRLLREFEMMSTIFSTSFSQFLNVFSTIESANPEVDYDKFCRVNKDNEKRKALSSFFVNLAVNGVISRDEIVRIACDLLKQVMTFIKEENKTSEVDEIIENILVLYTKEWFTTSVASTVEDESFFDVITRLARSKTKDYKSLSSKSIFKCMDIVEM